MKYSMLLALLVLLTASVAGQTPSTKHVLIPSQPTAVHARLKITLPPSPENFRPKITTSPFDQSWKTAAITPFHLFEEQAVFSGLDCSPGFEETKIRVSFFALVQTQRPCDPLFGNRSNNLNPGRLAGRLSIPLGAGFRANFGANIKNEDLCRAFRSFGPCQSRFKLGWTIKTTIPLNRPRR